MTERIEDVPATPQIPKGLALLRQPFPAHQISKLPKPTSAQTDAVKADFKKGIRCQLCGAWHHPDVIHLDYVGHAALTDRLLDADPAWTWEPVPNPGDHGLPTVESGMWIRLTVCGVTRFGFGHAGSKTGGDAVKEIIGDALRNAAMRFGAALDLWHKGQLHDESAEEPKADMAPRTRSTRAHTAASAEITEEQKIELKRIGNSLIDLVNEERENVSVDHAYTMWEMVETMDQDRLLWLSLYLDKHPRVLTRLKAVMVEERRKLRATAAAEGVSVPA